MDAINGPIRPIPPSQPRAIEPQDRSQALNILDEFQLSPLAVPLQIIPAPPGGVPIPVYEAPHGVKVEAAARDTGFPGKINRIQLHENGFVHNQRQALLELGMLPMEPEKARDAMDRYVQNESMAILLAGGLELKSQTEAATHQAVTNFSLGGGSAVATEHLYERARLGWTPPGPGEPAADDPSRHQAPEMMGNLARALGVKTEDLTSTDPAVFGPARAQLQQRLVDFTHQAASSPQVRHVHNLYAEAVSQYEAQGNSVVISAGNCGQLLDQMQRDNGGRAIQAPANFYQSALATSDTTRVGALGFEPDQTPTVASYSSGADQVEVLAWGRAYDGQPGTSFAAPRVGAVMQRIHQQNPGMSSAEVERRMLELQTIPVKGTRALTL